MSIDTNVRVNYNCLPLFDLTPYANLRPPASSEDEFAAAHDALDNYNKIITRIRSPSTYRAETGEELTDKNLYVLFQAAMCAISEKNVEDIEADIRSCKTQTIVAKIRTFAQVHLDKLNGIKLKKMKELIIKFPNINIVNNLPPQRDESK